MKLLLTLLLLTTTSSAIASPYDRHALACHSLRMGTINTLTAADYIGEEGITENNVGVYCLLNK